LVRVSNTPKRGLRSAAALRRRRTIHARPKGNLIGPRCPQSSIYGAKYTENAKNARPKGGKTAVGCRCLMREAIRPQNKNIACRCILALSPKRCPLRNAS